MFCRPGCQFWLALTRSFRHPQPPSRARATEYLPSCYKKKPDSIPQSTSPQGWFSTESRFLSGTVLLVSSHQTIVG